MSATKRNGTRNGVQLYKCCNCGRQFRAGATISDDAIWQLYQTRKQSVGDIAKHYGVSPSTIKRRLSNIKIRWSQPQISGGGYVHLDTTYWGHNWGVLLALDNASRKPLYLEFINHETIDDYLEALDSIEKREFEIRGIIIDGKKGLFNRLPDRRLQMCQYHMKEIVKRYLTKKPKLLAARELLALVNMLTCTGEEEFKASFSQWRQRWNEVLSKRSTSSRTGKSRYTHRRLRTAMNSLNFFLPYLFTFQHDECTGMPNTNNLIEGVFSDLKKNLNCHYGMNENSRKRFIAGFFKALG